MNTEKLVDLLETYSNAILGFVVVQSIAFAFTFGTSARFSCLVKNQPLLAPGLIAHFAISTALACVAIVLLGRTIQRTLAGLQPASRVLVKLYWAKAIVAVLFAGIPIFIVGIYGTLEDKDPKRCEQLK